MSVPFEIWDLFSAMDMQDMCDYLPFLRELARGKILEIGVCAGVSTSAFLLGMDEKSDGQLWSIDIDPSCGNAITHPRWTFLQGDSQNMPIPFAEGCFDTLLIDGDHHYGAASSDLRRFSPLVKNGGMILMHDVLPSNYARRFCPVDECRQAWDDFGAQHPTWESHIMSGLFGMGVMRKAER